MNEEMQSGEISKLIEWLQNNGHNNDDVINCIKFVTGKYATLEEFQKNEN